MNEPHCTDTDQPIITETEQCVDCYLEGFEGPCEVWQHYLENPTRMRRNADASLRSLWRAASADPTMENLAALGAAYLRSQQPPPPKVEVQGRRWFSRTNGNTIHTVRVWIDDELIGETESPVYGYGDQYVETGMNIAIEKGGLEPRMVYENGGAEAPWQWANRIGIDFKYYVEDVRRKRDL